MATKTGLETGTMNDYLMLVLVLLGGMGLGFLFFGGLWWTLRALPTARHPVLIMFASYFARMGLVVLGFFLLMAGEWERLVAAFAGFMIMRFVMVRHIRPPLGKPSEDKEEAKA